MFAHKSNKLIFPPMLWNRDTASIKICLQAGLAPHANSSIESLLSLQLSIFSSSSPLILSLGRSGSVCRSCRLRDRILTELGTVLADDSKEFSTLGAMWHLDSVLVGPFLDLAVVPGFNDGVPERFNGSRSRLRCRSRSGLPLQAGETGVATDRGDHLVAAGWLRSWDAMAVEPFFEI